MVNIVRRFVAICEPVVRADEVLQSRHAIIEVVVRTLIQMSMQGGNFSLGLEVEKLVVKDIAAVHVLISPVACGRNIEQASRIEFP